MSPTQCQELEVSSKIKELDIPLTIDTTIDSLERLTINTIRNNTIKTEKDSKTDRRWSAFVCIYYNSNLYVIRHTDNLYGAPGGKREIDIDSTPFQTAQREFKEETGYDIPTDWRFKKYTVNSHVPIYYYYLEATAYMMDMLYLGISPESTAKYTKQECTWISLEDSEYKTQIRIFQSKTLFKLLRKL